MFSLQQTPLLTLYTQQQHHKQRCMCSLRLCYLREKSFMGVEGSGLFNVIWLKSIHTFAFIVTVFTASASIRVSARNASLYIAVMIFCAQPYLKPCFMCPSYILSTCPYKGLCTTLLSTQYLLHLAVNELILMPQVPRLDHGSKLWDFPE